MVPQLDWSPNADRNPEAEHLLGQLFKGRARTVLVEKSWKSSSGRSMIYLINLRGSLQVDHQPSRSVVVKVGSAARLTQELNNYKEVAGELGIAYFVPATHMVGQGDAGALCYQSAGGVLGIRPHELMSLDELCRARIEALPEHIEQALNRLFEHCLRNLYNNTGLRFQPTVSAEVVQFWDQKWNDFLQGRANPLQNNDLWQQVPSALADQPALRQPDQLRRELLDDLHWSTPMAAHHGDVNLTNVLVSPNAVAIIDYEDMKRDAHILYDLVKLEVEFRNHLLCDLSADEYWCLCQVVNWLFAGPFRRPSRGGAAERWWAQVWDWLRGESSDAAAACKWRWSLTRRRARSGLQIILHLRRLVTENDLVQSEQERWRFDYCRWLSLYAFMTVGFEVLSVQQRRTALMTACSALQFWRARRCLLQAEVHGSG